MTEEEGGSAATIEDRAAGGEGDAGDGQMSIGLIEGSDHVSLATLIETGMPVQSEVSLLSAGIPARGLIDPHKGGKLIVSYTVSKYDVVPLHENGLVIGWKVRTALRPTYIEQVPEEK